MAKIDKIKEQIGWLKIVFGVLVAIDISILGWLTNNYNKEDISLIKIFIGLILVAIVTISIVITNKKAMKKIDELEEL